MSNFLITGGTGLIGRALIKKLLQNSATITLLTRDKLKGRKLFGEQLVCVEQLSELGSAAAIDYVINLAGEPIADKPWTEKQKSRLWQSRIELTENLVSWLAQLDSPVKMLLSGSAVGWYGDGGEQCLNETSKAHQEYTHVLCSAWEHAAKQATSYGINVCLMRTGLVLSADGGFLSKLLLPFKLGLGARLGKGEQYMSWIHIDDMVRAILFLLQQVPNNNEIKAQIVNLTSPNPVNNHDFTQGLAKQLHRPAFLVMPDFLLRWGLGEMSRLLLTGQKVMPDKLIELGFEFTYPALEDALKQVLD